MENEKQKMLELLADQVLFGLDEKDARELEKLRKLYPELSNDDSFELATAAINLTNLTIDEPLPAHMQEKLLAQAENFFDAPENVPNTARFESEEREDTQSVYKFEPRRNSVWQWLGWALAGAACVVLAINLWSTRFSQKTENLAENPKTIETPAPEPSLAQKREQLLASRDIVQTSWTEADPKKPKGISGDIVWSNAEQRGFMRFSGLPANDPSKETYQLWIFDETQNEKTPISGGVFDASPTGEIIIPIDAQIRVKKPKMFAVTAEKPGGVVVSKQEKIMAIAKIQA